MTVSAIVIHAARYFAFEFVAILMLMRVVANVLCGYALFVLAIVA